MPDATQVGVAEEEELDGPGHLGRGQATVDGAAEAADGAALREEPLDEPFLPVESSSPMMEVRSVRQFDASLTSPRSLVRP